MSPGLAGGTVGSGGGGTPKGGAAGAGQGKDPLQAQILLMQMVIKVCPI